MTEVKGSILFTAFFLALIFGLEYNIQLVKGLTVTKVQYNLQLDTCLTDTLRKAELGRRNDDYFFFRPDRVRKELEKQLAFAWNAASEEKAEETYQGMALLILFEPDGFYFFEPGMESVSEKRRFQADGEEKKLSELEQFMEERVKEQLELDGKTGSLRFTFPKEERAFYARTVKGTGLLLVYETEEAYFQERPYERFLLSGARVETAVR